MSEHRRSFIIVGGLHLPDLKVGSRVAPEAGCTPRFDMRATYRVD